MDIFKSMNQTKVADFSVFKSKKKNPVATEEQKEAVAEQNPVPQKESVAGRMTEKTVSPIKEEVPVEQAEKGDSVPEEFVPRENEKDNGNIIPFKQQENQSEEAAAKLEAELETAFTAVHRNDTIQRNTILSKRIRDVFEKMKQKEQKAVKQEEVEQLTL